MKIVERLKNGYKDKNYYVSIYDNGIYIINYKFIKSITSERIIIGFSSRNLCINGYNLKIKRKDKYDVEFTGLFKSMEFIDEESIY